MEIWKEVRRQVLTNELSQRAACQKYGLGWHTLMKLCPSRWDCAGRDDDAQRLTALLLPAVSTFMTP